LGKESVVCGCAAAKAIAEINDSRYDRAMEVINLIDLWREDSLFILMLPLWLGFKGYNTNRLVFYNNGALEFLKLFFYHTRNVKFFTNLLTYFGNLLFFFVKITIDFS